jgi:phosphatidylserine/phosphatidylglycerophosphate/cardiolipin synthase-like enzyme
VNKPQDITVPALNSLLSGRGSGRQQIEILAVRKVHPNTHRFLPVKLLVYGDVQRGETQLAVSVDGDLSQPHDLALDELGGAESLGIRVAVPDARPILPEDLEAIRVPSEEVAQLRSTTISGRIEAARADAASLVRSEPTSNAERALAEMPVRSVSVFEHKELLDEALDSAQVRILIISPLVKSAVVDTTFLGRLERRLQKGVYVHIAHGIGQDDRGSDDHALTRLAHLQQRYSKRFTLARLSNTHAKILVFDDKWISTSFNWLSFRGDPERTYRMEEGTLVQIPAQVNAAYERYVRIIGEQRIDNRD